MEGTIYICKMCGRSVRAQERPNFCYFDRVDHIENISDEDARKMGIQEHVISPQLIKHALPYVLEFPLDMRYNPFTGERVFGATHPGVSKTLSLQGFQNAIMEPLWAR